MFSPLVVLAGGERLVGVLHQGVFGGSLEGDLNVLAPAVYITGLTLTPPASTGRKRPSSSASS
jgi:hypothetical protein